MPIGRRKPKQAVVRRNLIGVPRHPSPTVFGMWDGENRMVESVIGGVTTAYVYDGEGRRVKKVKTTTAPATTTETRFVYNASGALAAEYGPVEAEGDTEYFMADHLGSTRLVTSRTGVPKRAFDYLPFGEEIPQGVSGRGALYPLDGATPTSGKKFTGHYRDSETGLDYFGARYLSAAQGRFTSPDQPFVDQYPENPQSWNIYAYVRNTPLAFIDDDGRQTRKPVPGAPGYTYRGDLTNPNDNPHFHIFNKKGHEIGRISVQEAYTGTVLESGNRETALRLITEGDVPRSVVREIQGLVQGRGIQPRFAAAGGPFNGFTVRGLGALSLLSVFTGAIAEYKQAQVTGVFTTIFGENKILDPTKAAENLGTGTIIQYTDKAGKSQFYTVRNGQFVRGGCNQRKENCGIPYPSEGSFTVVDLQ